VKISYDPVKRSKTLTERVLDFEDASLVIDGPGALTVVDDRLDYGEERLVTYGWLNKVAVAVVWTKRNGGQRIISMRRMHEEEADYVGLERP
jgi:uncharacterized DUF497 family protein